jgi:hypothetical protein
MSKSADTEPNCPNIPPDREALLDSQPILRSEFDTRFSASA